MFAFDLAATNQDVYRGFGTAPIPDSRDVELDRYLHSLEVGGPGAIASALGTASEAGRQVMRAHAERLASRAVRDRDPALLLDALVAAVLGGLDHNYREALLPMSLIDDAGDRLGVDLPTLLGDAAKIVGHPGTVNLMVWLTRAKEDRTPAAMGFVESQEDGGFRYRWAH